MNLKALKRTAKKLEGECYALYLACRHPKTPWYAKAFAALVVGYVFSPIDPIPDFIPGVGLLDEMVVVPLGVLMAAKMVPQEVLEECRERAGEMVSGERPVSVVAVVAVLMGVWLASVGLAVIVIASVAGG
jgi:uncharacterized membrane protein YkvA (DUF1232 family)